MDQNEQKEKNFKRYIGLETEYAIRFSSEHSERPDNRILYDLIIKIIPSYVRIAEGTSILKWKQIFTENGSAFCYESLPHHLESGLLEAATPECESPLEVLLYQKAIDRLLKKCLEKLNSPYKNSYPKSTISLIKNCKDAFDNIYGAQENYSGYIAKGIYFFLYRSFLVFYLPLLAFYILVVFLVSFLILFIQSILLIFVYFFYIIFISLNQKQKNKYQYEVFVFPAHKTFFYYFEKISGNLLTFTEIILSLPMIAPYVIILKYLTFRDYKKHLLPFLITRIIYTGSGSINKDGKYYLSEKAIFTKRIARTTNFPADRCIYDPGNLMKLAYLSVLSFFKLEFHYLKQLFSKIQRFQIGMSDSCMSEVSELLKVGPIYILMNMIDEGFLKNSPKISSPIQILKYINEYPNYKKTAIKIKNHTNIDLPQNVSAIDIQYWYLNQVKDYLKQRKVIQPEFIMIIQLWEDVLNSLKEEPEKLFGKIDWITKRILMNQAILKEKRMNLNHNNNNILDVEQINLEDYQKYYELLKIIDIKYHDIYEGYYSELEKANLTKHFFSEEEIENAIKNPPQSSSLAKIRSTIIRKMNQSYDNIKISWNYVRIGNGAVSKIIDLKDYKKKKN
ncbi:MAG: hypothetical protein KatS3mg129_0023 [Leptospiraceae bacterium]|nr:MAG: hypothetical protein KatS3mg129_0023 [Leptospiraceae bacterium]